MQISKKNIATEQTVENIVHHLTEPLVNVTTLLPQLDEDRGEGSDVLNRSVFSVWESPLTSVERIANSCY
jgi:hypothetical protein